MSDKRGFRVPGRESLLVLCSILAVFLLFEAFFRYGQATTDGFGFTLTAQRWFKKHWRPLNSFGIRDVEHDFQVERCRVFVVGDSFVAGHGIEDVADTFGRLLARESALDFDVVLVAQNGLDTRGEFELMQSLGVRPQLIVLSHFINDVEGAFRDAGLEAPDMPDMPRGLLAVVNHSHFLNHLYWRVFMTPSIQQASARYLEWLEGGYTDQTAMDLHRERLSLFTDYAGEHGIPLVAVVWPMLSDVAGTMRFTAPIVSWFRERGVPVLDLAERFQDRPAEELVVNAFDAHPNLEVSAEVAGLLLPLVEELLPQRCGDAPRQ
jgi:hypothetical protein